MKLHDCELTKSTDLFISLVLDTTTLEQQVAGCVLTARPVETFSELYDLGSRY